MSCNLVSSYFIISTNGGKNFLPDKECLAKIAHYYKEKGGITFAFNYKILFREKNNMLGDFLTQRQIFIFEISLSIIVQIDSYLLFSTCYIKVDVMKQMRFNLDNYFQK